MADSSKHSDSAQPEEAKPLTAMQFRTPLIGDLQARLSAPGLTRLPVEGEPYVIDIVQWAKDFSHCWTVAIIEPKPESAAMRTIGDRLLNVDWRDLEKIVRISYSFLEAL
jgi:hypothetical protein